MIDFSKPIETRDGRPVHLITEDLPPSIFDHLNYSSTRVSRNDKVLAEIDNALWSFKSDGSFIDATVENRNDLVNVVERSTEFRTFSEINSPHSEGHQLGEVRYPDLEPAMRTASSGWEGVLEMIREDGNLVEVKLHPVK